MNNSPQCVLKFSTSKTLNFDILRGFAEEVKEMCQNIRYNARSEQLLLVMKPRPFVSVVTFSLPSAWSFLDVPFDDVTNTRQKLSEWEEKEQQSYCPIKEKSRIDHILPVSPKASLRSFKSTRGQMFSWNSNLASLRIQRR